MKKLDKKTHMTICEAVEPLGESGNRPDEWLIFRLLAHALAAEGEERKRYLTEFAFYLESYLKQDA